MPTACPISRLRHGEAMLTYSGYARWQIGLAQLLVCMYV
jgi:hypothetical protein